MSMRTIVHACVVAPLLAGVSLMVVITVGGAVPGGPFAPDPPRNLAEAMALSDAATARRLLESGADPNAMYDIRPGMLASEVGLRHRPLAAAVYTSDDLMVGLAQRYGAQLPPDEARAVACWMAARGREAIGRMVAPSDWTAVTCKSVTK